MSAITPFTRVWAGAMLLACIGPALAAETATSAATPTRDLTAMTNAVANQQAQVSAARRAQSSATATATPPAQPSEIFANPYRTYPPSCLNDGLPFGGYINAPNALQAQVTLLGDPVACLAGGNAAECNFQETDTVTVWRIACSSGKSATLFEIDRPSGHSTTYYPTIPGITISQGANSNVLARFSDDPNTFLSTTFPNTPLYDSDVYVLENFYAASTQFDFNQSFVLTVDNFAGQRTTYNVAAYNAAQYPDASKPLELTGYLSGTWYDSTHSGEGILTQVYDNGDRATRTLLAAWFTYDANKLPFWIYAQASFAIGTRQVTNVPTYYTTGGGFAGNFTPPITQTTWGTMSFSFPDCNHMDFTFNGSASAVSGPTTNGSTMSRHWSRLANVNSVVCGP